MKNLDQIRAQNALDQKENIAKAKGGGDAISSFPMLVLTDGLLAALAFACEEKEVKSTDVPAQNHPDFYLFKIVGRGRNASTRKRKNPGQFTVVRALAAHLSTASNPITTWNTADDLLQGLANEETDTCLRRATLESLAFLNYLKRFVA